MMLPNFHIALPHIFAGGREEPGWIWKLAELLTAATFSSKRPVAGS